MMDPKKDWNEDWQDELESHLQLRADHDGNRESARRKFGNRLQISESVRAVHIPIWWDQFLQDLRYAFRSFLKTPGFTFAALLALALGIGAATAVFSVVDRILFRSLPYPNADRMVSIGMAAPLEANEFVLSTDYFEWKKSQEVFESFTATRGISDCDLTIEDPVRLRCGMVAANFLATFGLKPQLGRDFNESDDVPEAAGVVLISDAIWRGRFGASPGILGQTIELNRVTLRVIGVLPKSFEFPTLQQVDLLQTMRLRPPNSNVRQPTWFLNGYARLRPDQDLSQARDQFQPLYKEALLRVPERFRKEVNLRLSSLHDRQTRDSRLAARLLMISVVILLLIACTNVASLLLARAWARSREFSIRAAIGASSSRLLRQALTESLLLSGVGASLGVALAAGLLKGLVWLAPQGIPRLTEARLDWRVLLATAAVGVSCAIVFSFSSMAKGRLSRLRPVLVTLQIALSTVLLAGACVFLDGLWRLSSAPMGFKSAQILTAPIYLHSQRYPDRNQQYLFFENLVERVRQIPGVELVALTDSVPPLGRMMTAIASQIQVQGRPIDTSAPTGGMVVHRDVSPTYLEMLKIPILEGRDFEEADLDLPNGAVILSKKLATRIFPNGQAVGRSVRIFDGPFLPVVGIVADARNAGLSGKDEPEFYRVNRRGEGRQTAHLMVKSSAKPSLLAAALRKEVLALDPRLPVEFKTLDFRIGELTARQKFQSMLFASFAVAGLLLAAIGLHGVMAFLVNRRTSEIGLRIALGASRGKIHQLILGQAMRWTGIGLTLGLAASYPAFWYLKSLLFEVELNRPAAILSGAFVLVIVAFLAAWWPSLRATRIEAVAALRHD